jgi:hypothetical protein
MSTTTAAAEVVGKLARRLMNPGKASRQGARGRSLRLSDILEASGDEDRGPVELFEGASRPLLPRLVPGFPRGLPRSLRQLVHIGIDTSTRLLATPYADVVISALSISGPGPVELCDYPSLYSPLECGASPPPFIYVIPHGPLELPEEEGVALVPAAPQDISQALISQLANYARLSLERWAMEAPAQEIAKAFAELGRRPVVMLDGPIFISQGKGVGSLMVQRYEALRGLESLGFPVIGVVKRVERSSLLSSSPGYLRLLDGCGVDGSSETDSMILQRLASSCIAEEPGRVYVTPKIMARGGDGINKVVEYVVMTPSAWQRPGVRSRVYRLEYTEETLRMLEDVGVDPLQAFLADSIARESLEPVSVSMSDRRAKALTSSLRALLAKEVMGLGGRIGYESEVELRGLLEEGEE